MRNPRYLILPLVAGVAAFGLIACGDDVTEQNVINNTIDNVGAVDSKDSLPECNKEKAGQTAYVMDDNAFFGCDGEKWRQLNNSTVSFGDNVCTSEALPDDEGFKIICNGDSIGVVRNGIDGTDGKDGVGKDGVDGKDGADGKDGTDGKNGENGTSCKIKESTALTATIACGSETFTMDLTGYVTKSDDEECDPTKDSDCAENLGEIQIAGQSQKGPFVTGADVTAYELLNGRTLKQTGKTFSGKIEQANGSFNIKSVKLSSQFAYLVADGFYRNEVTGENSASSIKLRALTNLKGRSSANINLVTHLEYDRVSNLVTKKGLSVAKAKKQAETEIFAAFGINSDEFDAASKKGYAEDYNILSEGDGNAALLAISVMLQGDRTEAELTNLLASLSVDLTDSTWDNTRDRASVADWAFGKEFSKEGLESIRKNIENWKDGTGKKLATAVPAFEKYVKNFWRNEFKLGECSSKNANEIKAAAGNKYSAHYATSDSVSVEGESLTRFICAANGTGENATYAWREATDYEKDTAKLPAPTANAIASGMVNTDFVYVVEDGKWRRGTNLDASLKKSCTASRVGTTDSLTSNHELKWYICDKNNEVLGNDTVVNSWRIATTAEADTAFFGTPSSNIARIGNVNKERYYVFEINSETNEGAWRYGTMYDVDDGLGPCIKDSLNKIRKLDGIDGANAWFKCVNDKVERVDGERIPYVWRAASNYEMDTDSLIRAKATESYAQGPITKDHYYVKESYGWRPATELEQLGLKACIESRNNIVITDSKGNWYKCTGENAGLIETFKVEYTWRVATTIEKDTIGWGSDEPGEKVRNGNVNTTKTYVYENGSWRYGTDLDSLLNKTACTSENAANDTSSIKTNGRYYICSNTPKDTIPYQWVDAGDWYNETIEERSKCAGESAPVGELMTGKKSGQNYICTKEASWQIPANKIDSTLGGCREAIEDSVGHADKKYRYCDNTSGEWKWREATKIEYDTYRWNVIYNNAKDGDFHEGNVTKNSWYVFDKKLGGWVDHSYEIVWDYKLRGCTKTRAESADTVRALDEDVYACKMADNIVYWEMINDPTIYDTYGATCPEEGKLYTSSRSGNKYACDDGKTFRAATAVESAYGLCVNSIEGHTGLIDEGHWYCNGTRWLSAIKDTRNNKIYPIITIGDQTWMAANLNLPLETGSLCYDNDEENCDKYGRLYNWYGALDCAGNHSNDTKGCEAANYTYTVDYARGICPKGWHIPREDEWATLKSATGGETKFATRMKSKDGWTKYSTGTDSYDFKVLPAGEYLTVPYESITGSYAIGWYSVMWSSKQGRDNNSSTYAVGIKFAENDNYQDYDYSKKNYYSVRCVKDYSTK